MNNAKVYYLEAWAMRIWKQAKKSYNMVKSYLIFTYDRFGLWSLNFKVWGSKFESLNIEKSCDRI
jgi:hypothetical protein